MALMILGASQCKYMHCHRATVPSKFTVHCHSGDKVQDVCPDVLQELHRVNTVVLQYGTNNVPKEKPSVTGVLPRGTNLYVWDCLSLEQQQEEERRVQDLNGKALVLNALLHQLSFKFEAVTYVDHWDDFEHQGEINRTRISTDGLHLTPHGVQTLLRKIVRVSCCSSGTTFDEELIDISCSRSEHQGSSIPSSPHSVPDRSRLVVTHKVTSSYPLRKPATPATIPEKSSRKLSTRPSKPPSASLPSSPRPKLPLRSFPGFHREPELKPVHSILFSPSYASVAASPLVSTMGFVPRNSSSSSSSSSVTSTVSSVSSVSPVSAAPLVNVNVSGSGNCLDLGCREVRCRGGGLYDEGRQCEVCLKVYKSKQTFFKHPCKKNCPDEAVIIKESVIAENVFQCDECHSQFSTRQALNSHNRNYCCSRANILNRRKCLEPGCEISFYNVGQMYEHMQKSHLQSSSWSVVEKDFANLEEFKEWKENEDTLNFMNMRREAGVKCHKGTQYRYYLCNFNKTGSVISNPDKKQRLSGSGPAPALECPARMSVKEYSNGTVHVKYLKNHNHKQDFTNNAHYHFSESCRKYVKTKLSEGVEIDRIRKDVRGEWGDRELRNSDKGIKKDFYISNKQIRDTRRNMRNRERNPLDASSVAEKVERLKKETFNPVVIYKQQHRATEIGNGYLDAYENVFALGLQSKEQFYMLKEGAHRVVCMDSTFGTTAYDFQLLNIVVPDKYRVGYPVAHFIVSTLDKAVMVGLIQSLKDRYTDLGITLDVTVIMTDDDGFSGPVFQQIFGDSVRHLLCTWHVYKAWTTNLSKVKNPDFTAKVRAMTEMLQKERSLEKFDELVQYFRDAFSITCPLFYDYFEKGYLKRPQLWAAAYRNFPHCQTNTNMFCESFHNKLKTYYMKRTPNLRVDDLVDLLLEIEKDAHINLQFKIKSGIPSVLSKLNDSRHSKGFAIPDRQVFKFSEGGLYEVCSQTWPGECYEVRLIKDKCDCSDKCFECTNLCPHNYTCNCRDDNSLCKHIHKVNLMFRRSFDKPVSNEEADSINAQAGVLLGTETVFDNSTKDKQPNSDPVSHEQIITDLQGDDFSRADFGDLANLEMNNQSSVSTKDTPTESLAWNTKNCWRFNRALEDLDFIASKLKNENIRSRIPRRILQNIRDIRDVVETVTEIRDPDENDLESISVDCKEFSKNEGSDKISPHSKLKKQIQQFKKKKKRVSLNSKKNLLREKIEKEKEIIAATCEAVHSESQMDSQDFSSSLNLNLSDFEDPYSCSFKVDSINLSIIDLKTLDSELSPTELLNLKKIDPEFQVGWLTDKVIDAYLNILCKQHVRVKAVTCLLTKIIQACSTFNLPTGWEDCDKILFPCNLSGSHWVLFVYDVKARCYHYFNSSPECDNTLTLDEKNFLLAINSNLGMEHSDIIVECPEVAKQTDSFNCGVFVCFYSKLCASGEQFAIFPDVIQFRREICLDILRNSEIFIG